MTAKWDDIALHSIHSKAFKYDKKTSRSWGLFCVSGLFGVFSDFTPHFSFTA